MALEKVLKPLEASSSKKPKINVLDEDTYIESVEKIIEKDFFPDLAKLNAQAEYFDALERKDTQKIWQLKQQFSKLQSNVFTPCVSSTPSTFETPLGRPLTNASEERQGNRSPSKLETTSLPEKTEGPSHNPEPEDKLQDVGLDRFLAQNTSEDNISFGEIMKEAEKKHRLKHDWLFEKEDEQKKEREQCLALPSIEEQAISQTSKHVQTWTYVPRNALMYSPDGAPESEEEMIRRKASKPREIVHENTRFTVVPFNEEKSQESVLRAASNQALLLQGKIGADGKEVLPQSSPQIGKYGFVATPSPAPGVDASPLMTWGEIEGTPFRLDGSDTPLVQRTPGPVFKIPEVPRRDRLLMELAEKASKAHRAKKQEAMKQCQASFNRTASTPSPKTDRLWNLSPAAQRLITKRFGVRPNSAKSLKASYTPSPHRRPSTGDKTPSASPILSPSSGRTPTGTSSHTSLVQKRPQKVSITDDLLRLPKRPKAQDFFD